MQPDDDSLALREIADSRPASRPSGNEKPGAKYCVITAVRDEEQFIAGTIESVLHQTIRPIEWIIVDDGSTDTTHAVIDRCAREHSWIRILRRADRGYRSKGGGVEAFLYAYPMLLRQDWEFLVNLDGDLTFSPEYFEKCFGHFRSMPRLGIGGGTIYDKVDNHLHLESSPKFHVRGGTKVYRRECWEKLGGLFPSLGWDTVDEIKANWLGWNTETFPELQLVHHRASGAVWGAWGRAVNEGEADHIVGYHPLFFGIKCARHVFNPPYVIRSLGIAYGFLRGIVKCTPHIGDQELRVYLRKQQLRRLFGMPSIWK
jgi:biofilm PGA synthesis N-glycosyltransferase PgaC